MSVLERNATVRFWSIFSTVTYVLHEYKYIQLIVVLSPCGKNVGRRCSRTGCLGECFDLRRMK